MSAAQYELILISSGCYWLLLSHYYSFHNDLTIAIRCHSLRSISVDISIFSDMSSTISEQ